MNRYFFLPVLILLLCFTATNAQRAPLSGSDAFYKLFRLKGVVRDSATLDSIAGAKVFVYVTASFRRDDEAYSVCLDDSLVWSGVSDSLGRFSVDSVYLPGVAIDFRLAATKMDYKTPVNLYVTKAPSFSRPAVKGIKPVQADSALGTRNPGFPLEADPSIMQAVVYLKKNKSVKLIPKDD